MLWGKKKKKKKKKQKGGGAFPSAIFILWNG